MWKNIILIITVVLAAAAVWLLVDMRGIDTREQFINCKIENVQLTIQYGRCLEVLYEVSEPPSSTADGSHGETTDNPETGDMSAGPALTTMFYDPDPGGMITDPDPGGMVGDPDSGNFAFAPSGHDLKQCGVRNLEFRTALKACADALEHPHSTHP